MGNCPLSSIILAECVH